MSNLIALAHEFPTIGYGVAIDIESAIRQEGIELEYWPFESKIVGALIEYEPGCWTIVCNTNIQHGRRRFTLAHELVHYKLHRNLIPTASLWCSSGGRRPYMEREADHYAAAILIPENTLRPLTASCTWTVKELADAYQVSKRAMEIRLSELGITQ